MKREQNDKIMLQTTKAQNNKISQKTFIFGVILGTIWS